MEKSFVINKIWYSLNPLEKYRETEGIIEIKIF